jgi:hypothetical protein
LRRLFLPTVFILLIILALVFIPPFFVEDPRVSHEGLKDYVEEYLSEYRQFVEANYALLASNLTLFPLYLRSPNKMEGVISQTHGAAILFNYSTRETRQITIEETKDPIEYFVWPSMPRNTSGLKWVLVKHGDYYFDSPVSYSYGLLYCEPGVNMYYAGQGHVFNISGLGAIVIFGSLIEENGMILKGTNNKEDWSKVQASLDAFSDFVWDCKQILDNTTTRGIEVRYKPTLMLDKIASRIQSGIYRDNPGLFTADYEELQEAGASNETLSKVQEDYMTMQEALPPSWTDQAWTFIREHIIGDMLCSAIIGGIIVAVLLKRFRLEGQDSGRETQEDALNHDARKANSRKIPKT